MMKLVKVLAVFVTGIILSVVAVGQQEIDPSYYSPVPPPAVQSQNSVSPSRAASGNKTPKIMQAAYHPRAQKRGQKPASATGRRNRKSPVLK